MSVRRYRFVVGLYAAAVFVVALTATAPSLWTRKIIKDINERQLRLRRLANATLLYGGKHEEYPAVATCRDLQTRVAPSTVATLTCADPAGDTIRYAYVRERCEGCTPEQQPVVRFVFVSTGADKTIDRKTAELLAAAQQGQNAFEDVERSIAAAATKREWHEYVDKDIVITDAGFLTGVSGLDSFTPPPRYVRQRAWLLGAAIAVILIGAAMALQRRNRTSTGPTS